MVRQPVEGVVEEHPTDAPALLVRVDGEALQVALVARAPRDGIADALPSCRAPDGHDPPPTGGRGGPGIFEGHPVESPERGEGGGVDVEYARQVATAHATGGAGAVAAGGGAVDRTGICEEEVQVLLGPEAGVEEGSLLVGGQCRGEDRVVAVGPDVVDDLGNRWSVEQSAAEGDDLGLWAVAEADAAAGGGGEHPGSGGRPG